MQGVLKMFSSITSHFKAWSIKKYHLPLQSKLAKRYGKRQHYTAHQVRATVYQCCFNPRYLPLGYILYLSPSELIAVMRNEFPEIELAIYKQEFNQYLERFTDNRQNTLKHDCESSMVQ